MQPLAAYAILGFTAGETSRFDQVMAGMDELPLPEGANWMEMTRLARDEAISRLNGLRVVTRSGLVAQSLALPEELAGISQVLDGTHMEPLVKPSSEAITEELPTFPIRSIFRPSEATA